MKKLMGIVLALVMILSLSACANNAPAQSSAPAESSSAAAPSESASSAAPSESASTSEAGTFIVGNECNYAPYNWKQSNDSFGAVAIDGGGYAAGYDIEMAKLIAAGLNKKLVIQAIEWNGLVPACQSGVIDAIVAGMSPLPERKEVINFTDTYCAVSVGIVVKKGGKYENAANLDDFAGAKITGQLNTFHYDLIDQIKGVAKQTAMDDFPAMRLAVQSGIVDGYVSEEPSGVSAAMANKDLAFVKFAEGKGFTSSSDELLLAIGIAKENTDLLDQVNKILAGITQEQRAKFMDDALKNQPIEQE